MGRSPCCDKVGLKKGPWTPEEDQKLLAYIEEHGHGSWRALPAKAGLERCGKSCRLRWTNYLRPDIKRGKFTLQEEQTIIQLHALLGNRWSAIATHLPKRTDNEIKNYWNTHLKKRLAKMGIDPITHKPKNDTLLISDGSAKNAANLSHMAQWESARLEAESRLVQQTKLRSASLKNLPEPSCHLNKPEVPPIGPSSSLDILKPWNGGGGSAFSVTGIGDHGDSPSSTLTCSTTTGMGENSTTLIELLGNSWGSGDLHGGTTKEENNEDGVENSMRAFSPVLRDLTIIPPCMDSAANTEHIPTGNFVETFTDLLDSTTSADRRFCGGGSTDSDNGGRSSGGDSYYEDNKNYWNSILNLVHSSPSDSPMF